MSPERLPDTAGIEELRFNHGIGFFNDQNPVIRRTDFLNEALVERIGQGDPENRSIRPERPQIIQLVVNVGKRNTGGNNAEPFARSVSLEQAGPEVVAEGDRRNFIIQKGDAVPEEELGRGNPATGGFFSNCGVLSSWRGSAQRTF